MFNKDFYPTPDAVIEQMIADFDIKGKVILEPSAGKGNIVDYLSTWGAKEVLTCENNHELQAILRTKSTLIESDFLKLTADRISHVDYIIMNPPFSADETHILHAWDIAPDGCTIIALCNYETLDNKFTRSRRKLTKVIEDNGKSQNLGNCFSTAERTTDVEVGLVTLFKPSEGEDEFEGYFELTEEYDQGNEPGLMSHDSILEIVNRYVGAVKMFDQVMEANERINELIKPINGGKGTIEFGANIKNTHIYTVTREVFKKELQKSAWHKVFNKLKMDKYVTSSVMSEINKFVEKQENVPFTRANIYKMIYMIVGTHGSRMNKVLIEVFDWLTGEYHKENRYGVEGWKTNSMYLVNQKFIAPYAGVSIGYSGQPDIRWSQQGERMDELTKALCNLTGRNYDDYCSLHDFFMRKEEPNPAFKEAYTALATFANIDEKTARFIHRFSGAKNLKWELCDSKISDEILVKAIEFYETHNYGYESRKEKVDVFKPWGQWLDWGFFEIRVYKKGTLHAKFKDVKVWELFNQACAKAKGWRLPTNTGSDVRRKKTDVEVF